MSQGSLARRLSQLEGFSAPKLELEQYTTPGSIAAELLWSAYMSGDIEGRSVVDLGAGTGVLGIGALILGAQVTFVETDPDAILVLERNLSGYEGYSIVEADVSSCVGSFDTAVMNPPFGAQERHADKRFLLAAMKLARVVYSIHNANSTRFLASFFKDHSWRSTIIAERSLSLSHAYNHHSKPRFEQAVVVCRSTNV